MVLDDMLGRRFARVFGMEPASGDAASRGMVEVTGEAPLARLADFPETLRSLTDSRATYAVVVARGERPGGDDPPSGAGVPAAPRPPSPSSAAEAEGPT